MEKKIIDFIIRHFGCFTTKGDEKVLTSLGNMSFASEDEISDVFSGQADKYIIKRKSEDEGKRTIILKENVRKEIEKNYLKNDM